MQRTSHNNQVRIIQLQSKYLQNHEATQLRSLLRVSMKYQNEENDIFIAKYFVWYMQETLQGCDMSAHVEIRIENVTTDVFENFEFRWDEFDEQDFIEDINNIIYESCIIKLNITYYD